MFPKCSYCRHVKSKMQKRVLLAFMITIIMILLLGFAGMYEVSRQTSLQLEPIKDEISLDQCEIRVIEAEDNDSVIMYLEPEPEPQPSYWLIDYQKFMRDGVWSDDTWPRYTWYSSNTLYHYRTSEWELCDDFIYRDDQGRVIVACDVVPEGTEVWSDTFGRCIVLDCGVGHDGLDIYCAF